MNGYAKYVTFNAQVGKGDELIGLLLQSRQLATAAAGHRLMTISRDSQQPDRLYMFDIWETVGDHDAFQGVAEQRRVVNQVIELLVVDPDRIELEVI